MSDDDERGAQLGQLSRSPGRTLANLGHRLAAELPLAARAARQLRARPALVWAVVAFATASWFSHSYVGGIVVARGYALAGQPVPAFERSRLTFAQRWAANYRPPVAFLLLWPLGRFASPLQQPSSVASQWIRLAYYPAMMRQFRAEAHPSPAARPRQAARTAGRDSTLRGVRTWRLGYPLAISVPAVLVSVLIVVGLLGWVRDQDRPIRLADLPEYWRRHYWPVLVVALISGAFAELANPVLNWLAEATVRSEPSLLSGIAQTIYGFASWAVTPIIGLLLMFAPFVIVARGAGWRRGIIEGLRLWRSRWPALVALFIVYRIGWEVVALWSAATSWDRWNSIMYRAPGLSSPPVLLAWSWVGSMGLALLGLWVAYAFMEIARGPEVTNLRQPTTEAGETR